VCLSVYFGADFQKKFRSLRENKKCAKIPKSGENGTRK